VLQLGNELVGGHKDLVMHGTDEISHDLGVF
jgi:hypothetical protein